MDPYEESKVMLKILDILDQIRKNTERMLNIADNKRGIPAKRDAEVDELLGRRRTLSPSERPLDDTIERR